MDEWKNAGDGKGKLEFEAFYIDNSIARKEENHDFDNEVDNKKFLAQATDTILSHNLNWPWW